MGWAGAKKLTVLFLVPLAGCGEEAEPSAPDPAPASLLIQEGDLPAGVDLREKPPDTCSPLRYLQDEGAKAAVSPLFNFGNAAVSEAVGIAPSEEKALVALDALSEEKRIECIGEAIATFGPEEGVSVEYVAPVPISTGEDGSLIRFLEVDQASKPVNTTAVTSFRSGRCVVSLLVAVKGSDDRQEFIDRVSERAHKRLARAHSTCR